MMSFPQIVVGEVLVGGFQQLVQADQTRPPGRAHRAGRLARRRRGRGWQLSHT